MPTAVTEEPLGIGCVFSDGRRAAFDLSGLPNRRLARDLALALVELIHPHGSADSASTVDSYVGGLRAMVRALAGQGFTGGAGDLRRGQLARFWMAGPSRLEALTRALVEGYARSGGALGDGVLELAAGRHFNIQPNRRPLPPYPEVEWQRLIAACRDAVDASYAAHRRALAAIGRGGHPATAGWAFENFCWLLARLGPVSTPVFAREVGVSHSVFHNRGPRAFYDAVQAVFPHLEAVIGYRLLFGAYAGIVPDGIADLGVDDIDWAGDSTILLSYVKRRTAAESLNLPRPAVRLLQQWLSHSALLRGLVAPEHRGRLWLGLSYVGRPLLIGEVGREAVHRWVRGRGLLGVDGRPLKIHRARIRTTHHALREKTAWTGNARATIDPNHTPAVEGDHYLSATTAGQRQAAETIIEDAQHDLLRRAHPPTVITEEDTAALAGGYPQLIAAMNIDDDTIAELVGGARDVFTAACADQLSGLHGPAGKPCPARPWVCLLCPLAVFAPRHAVNLLRLKAFFSRQWRAMPAAQFMAVFGPYATRLDQVLARFDPAELGAAARAVGGHRRGDPAAPGGDDRMSNPIADHVHDERPSPFAGQDVCRRAGLGLPKGVRRPRFEDDLWDFTEVVGLAVHVPLAKRRFDFAAIGDTRWRLLAKELIMAVLAPRHPAVAELPRAYRTPLHLRSCAGRLGELARFFRWLRRQHVTTLAEIDDHTCQAYLAFRRHIRGEDGTVVGERSPAVRRAAAQIIVDLVDYRELFTADRVRADLRPWGGASASAVAEMRCGRDGNTTPAVPGEILQPMLAAALHLVQTLGAHAVALNEQIRRTDRISSLHAPGLRRGGPTAVADIAAVLADHTTTGTPLPMSEDHDVNRRLAAGWSPDDPLLNVATGTIARQAGYTRLSERGLPALRAPLLDAVATLGVEKPFARDATATPTADGTQALPWSLPLHRSEAVAVVGIVRTAAIIVLAASSGMRSSELMELRIGCRRPVEEPIPGLKRFRIASTIVKGQPLGGTADEWVVIEPAYRAVHLAEQLHADPGDGVLLFSRFAFNIRYAWFRNWVNSPAGQRLRLAPIPEGPVSLRMLRRTIALELAYRPGGILAAKLQLKHIATATTEGYAARPGGAQAALLTEVNKHEADRNLQQVLAEFHNYRQGILPAGPGARSLVEFFTSIDADLNAEPAQAPNAQRNDRDILNLLSKRAEVLHLGVANYCWFTDPSRALCLKLAGTPAATTPLIGMCDSARCPQATHHQAHRPVWAEHAERTKTFLGQLGKKRTTERERLTGEHTRALRVISNIDAAATPATDKDQA